MTHTMAERNVINDTRVTSFWPCVGPFCLWWPQKKKAFSGFVSTQPLHHRVTLQSLHSITIQTVLQMYCNHMTTVADDRNWKLSWPYKYVCGIAMVSKQRWYETVCIILCHCDSAMEWRCRTARQGRGADVSQCERPHHLCNHTPLADTRTVLLTRNLSSRDSSMMPPW